MARTKTADVIGGFSQIVDHLHSQDQIEVFSAPVIVSRGFRDSQGNTGSVAAEHHTSLTEDRDGSGEKCGGHRAMQQEGLDGIACSWILGFAVQSHPHGFLHIRRRIHIKMADSIRVSQHGNAGVVLNEPNQFVAASGNDQINQTIQLQQCQAFLTGRQKGQCIRGDRTGGQPCLDRLHHRFVGASGFTAPFEQGTIA